MLAESFLREHPGDERNPFSEAAARKRSRGTWPGNARERRITVRNPTDVYSDAVLEATLGRKSEAARILGMNRHTPYRREENSGHSQRREGAIAGSIQSIGSDVSPKGFSKSI